ncbi:LysR substrate-binding domain-containing protein [Peredibacter sp. HCB2-198]|uniref:LysR family transcriptional regulator n=1 Tax=Peredibacter sp. HCB2-198 TaxID=3383025 RepID=UPI0038B5D09F
MDLIDFNEINIFLKVVQYKSFSKAASNLGLPVSTVSTKVSSLEKRLGTTLLQRSTRKLVLTESGVLYFNQCMEGFEQIHQAEKYVHSTQLEPQGRIRITAPTFLGSTLLPDIITEMCDKYPKIKVELMLSDYEIDIISEGIDIAIRAGELKDSSLIAKKLGDAYFMPFASKKFLKEHGLPNHPKELSAYRCIGFPPLGKNEWSFFNEKSKVKVPITESLTVDELNLAEALARNHQGIALLPNFVCDKKSYQEDLIRVLPEWKSSHRPVYFVYSAQKYLSPKIKIFMEIAEKKLRPIISR